MLDKQAHEREKHIKKPHLGVTALGHLLIERIETTVGKSSNYIKENRNFRLCRSALGKRKMWLDLDRGASL